MKIFIVLSLLGLFTFSCRKFKHEVEVPSSCELCDYADEIQGSYRGNAYGLNLNGQSWYSEDSLTIIVSHVYNSKGIFLDSNIMFFELSYIYDNPGNFPDTIKQNVSMTSAGKLNISNYDTADISTDRLVLYDEFYNHLTGGIMVYYSFTGHRIP